MGDGVLLTRFFAFLVVGWPAVAVVLVYTLARSRISRGRAYFFKALAVSYGIALAGPVVLLMAFMLAGRVAEVAVLYTGLVGIPLFAVAPVVVAVRVAAGRSDPERT